MRRRDFIKGVVLITIFPKIGMSKTFDEVYLKDFLDVERSKNDYVYYLRGDNFTEIAVKDFPLKEGFGQSLTIYDVTLPHKEVYNVEELNEFFRNCNEWLKNCNFVKCVYKNRCLMLLDREKKNFRLNIQYQ